MIDRATDRRKFDNLVEERFNDGCAWGRFADEIERQGGDDCQNRMVGQNICGPLGSKSFLILCQRIEFNKNQRIVAPFLCILALLVIVPLTLNGTALHAAIRLAASFSSHMVLQRGVAAPVWRWASLGQSVTVEFAGHKVAVIVQRSEKWMVKLPVIRP